MAKEGARVRRSLWDERFAHDSTKVSQFPVAAERPVEIAKRLDSLATQREARLPAATLGVPTRAEFDAAKTEVEHIRSKMIAWQEELDWQVYRIYGVLDEALCYADVPPGLQLGERAFEILLARQLAAGTTSTTWFERHGAQPLTECPAHVHYALVERRISTIQQSRDLALIERPECKCRWAGSDSGHARKGCAGRLAARSVGGDRPLATRRASSHAFALCGSWLIRFRVMKASAACWTCTPARVAMHTNGDFTPATGYRALP